MTSDLVGSQWLQTANATLSRPTIPSIPPPRPHRLQFPSENFWDPGGIPPRSDQVLETTSKRQKTENETTTSRGGSQTNFAVPQRPRTPNKQFHGWANSGVEPEGLSNIKSVWECDNLENTRRGPLAIPQRPAKSTSRSGDTFKSTVAVENVQTKPYTAERPAPAPHFKYSGSSMYTSMRVEIIIADFIRSRPC